VLIEDSMMMEVEHNAYKDFNVLKPPWCKGSLLELTDRKEYTKLYVNFAVPVVARQRRRPW